MPRSFISPKKIKYDAIISVLVEVNNPTNFLFLKNERDERKFSKKFEFPKKILNYCMEVNAKLPHL